jgi:insulysin
VKDIRYVALVFNFPDQRPHVKCKPGFIISHIIGYEGPGSLLSYLKTTKHWVDSLYAGLNHICEGTETFDITMTMTKAGLGTLICAPEANSVKNIMKRWLELYSNTLI